MVRVARELVKLGFSLAATAGTADALEQAGMTVRQVNKVLEGRPHIVDFIKNDEADMIINTTEGGGRLLIRPPFAPLRNPTGVLHHHPGRRRGCLHGAEAGRGPEGAAPAGFAQEHSGMNKFPMTVSGEASLREELDRLKRVERPRITQAIAEARAHGDLKENAEYHAPGSSRASWRAGLWRSRASWATPR